MDRQATREQVERLLSSDELAGKDQLKKLLAFLFERMDSQGSLQPTRVIEELWPGQAGVKRASALATEMNRLRRALDSYYSGPGQADAVVIRLPSRSTPAMNGNRARQWITFEDCVAVEEEAPGVTEAAPISVPAASERKARRRQVWVIAAMAALATLVYGAVRLIAPPPVPIAGRIDGTVLTIMDAKGKELWRKGFLEGLWKDYYEPGLATRMWFGDLDGDGHTEVLFLYHPSISPTSHSTTLICYSDRGEERWRWTPGRSLPEISGSPSVFQTSTFGITKPGQDRRRRIVLTSFHFPYYPDQIAVVGSDGKLQSEYWHSGHLYFMTLADLDGDGREEIIATGTSNGYREATLIALDLDRVSGASTEAARPEVQIHGMGVAKERARLLFPRSDLNREENTYNTAMGITNGQNGIQLPVDECALPRDCDIYYQFDKRFNLLSVSASDAFRNAHAEFYLKARNGHIFDAKEDEEFRKIRCLAGCDFDHSQVRGQ